MSEYNKREYSPISSVLKPYIREIKNSDGGVIGIFEQKADTRIFEVLTIPEQRDPKTGKWTKIWNPFTAFIKTKTLKLYKWLTKKEKDDIISNVQSAKLTGKKHTTIDKSDVDAVIANLYKPLSDDTEVYNLFKDNRIDESDVEYVRYAIKAQAEKNGILVDINAANEHIEDLVKFTVKPTSTKSEVYLNGKLSEGKAILVKSCSSVEWKVVCGNYTETGTYENIEKATVYTVSIKEDVTASNFIAAASNSAGGDIVVTEDTTASCVAQGILAAGTTILDMSGHTFTATDQNRPAFNIRGTNTYIFKGEGTVISESTKMPAVWANSKNCKVIINSGTFVSHDESGECIYAYLGQVEIYGGTFKSYGAETENIAKYLVNIYDASRKNGMASVKIYGGQFYGFDPANSNDGNLLAEGCVSIEMTDENGDAYFMVGSVE